MKGGVYKMSDKIHTREFCINDYDAALQLWHRVKGLEIAEGDEREDIAQFLARNPGLSRLAAGTGRVPTPSYIRSMRVAIFLATLLAGSVSAIASATSITSPDHPRTFAYGEITWRQLYLEPTCGGLMARITFSNLLYASDDEPRRDE